MERVPNKLHFDFSSGSKRPLCGGLEYSGDTIYYSVSVSR